MYEIYKNILGINVSSLSNKTVDEVALEFQNSTDKEFRNKCFSYIFRNIYPLLLKLHKDKKFSGIPFEERTEECLCGMLYALEHWRKDKGQKLTSHIFLVITSRLKTMNTKLNNNKNKVFKNLVSLPPNKLSYILDSEQDRSAVDQMNQFIKDLHSSTILNKHEIEFCEHILAGYRTIPQIAEKMSHIKMIPKMTRKKNAPFSTVPIETLGITKYCCKLKDSIRKKVRSNNREFI